MVSAPAAQHEIFRVHGVAAQRLLGDPHAGEGPIGRPFDGKDAIRAAVIRVGHEGEQLALGHLGLEIVVRQVPERRCEIRAREIAAVRCLENTAELEETGEFARLRIDLLALAVLLRLELVVLVIIVVLGVLVILVILVVLVLVLVLVLGLVLGSSDSYSSSYRDGL